MRLIIVGFCAGVISLVQFSFIPSVPLLLCTGMIFALLVNKWSISLLPLGFCLGLSWASWDAHIGVIDRLPSSLEGETLTIRLKIRGLPDLDSVDPERGVLRFSGDIETVDWPCEPVVGVIAEACDKPSLKLPSRVRLSWYGAVPADMGPGEIWNLTVRLQRPHGFANLGGFDYERWLFHKKIGAVGNVVNGADNRQITTVKKNTIPAFSIDQTRQSISREIQSQFNQFHTASLLSALMVGDRSFITSDQWAVLRESGTSHLFAISGLHIGLVAGLFYGLASWGWRIERAIRGRLTGQGLVRVSAPHFAAVVGLLAAIVYSAAAGFSLPTLRALLMLAVLVVFRLMGKQSSLFDGLLGAAFMVLLIFPRSPLDAGFWLSFSAVAIIFWVINGRLVRRDKGVRWRQMLTVQWAVFIGLIPLLIVMFGQVSLISPLVNVVAVPLVGLLLVPLALVGAFLLLLLPKLGLWLIKYTLILFDWAWEGLAVVVQWSPSPYPLVDAGLVCTIMLVVAVIILLAPKALPYKGLMLLALLPFLYPMKEAIGPRQLKLTIFDVGHGLSVLVRTQNYSLLFDAGNRYSATRNAGEGIILPYLQHKGVKRLDKVILSHGDIDHVGGARSVLEGIAVTSVTGAVAAANIDLTHFTATKAAARDSIVTALPEKKGPCRQGQAWIWDNIHFDILFPGAEGESLFDSSNNQSCVLRIKGDNFAILIPGDIERPVEEYLLKGDLSALRADLLIAPHHGSDTSSTSGFINAVNPRQVIFTAGYQDRFGHPTDAVMRRYKIREVDMLNTSLTGTIEYDFLAGEKMPKALLYREQYKGYWHMNWGSSDES